MPVGGISLWRGQSTCSDEISMKIVRLFYTHITIKKFICIFLKDFVKLVFWCVRIMFGLDLCPKSKCFGGRKKGKQTSIIP